MVCRPVLWSVALAASQVLAQDPAMGTLTQGRQTLPAPGMAAMALAQDGAPAASLDLYPKPLKLEDQPLSQTQNERLDREIRLAKAKEKGPLRFAADLFETRQYGINPTDGGIAEDYVLGVGDSLQMNVFGSATFEVPVKAGGTITGVALADQIKSIDWRARFADYAAPASPGTLRSVRRLLTTLLLLT